MTGEITLLGEVLPIGGLPEKLMAAKRSGIFTILIPESNVKDLKEVPKAVLKGLNLIPVKTIDQVWKLALRKGKPVPIQPPLKAGEQTPFQERGNYSSVVPSMNPINHRIDLNDLEIEEM